MVAIPPIPDNRTATLGDMALRTDHLLVECNLCGRLGRYLLTRLVERHGAATLVRDFGDTLNRNCPRIIEHEMDRPCGMHYPGLGMVYRWVER